MKKTISILAIILMCISSISFAGEKKIYEIEYIESSGVNLCNVVFYQNKPKPSIVDEMVLQALKMSIKIDDSKEILATAFYENDTMSSSDYSGMLVYDPSKKKIITLDEHEGIKITVYDAGKYFVKMEELESVDKSKWLSIMIVFPEKPAPQQAYNAIIETIIKYKHKGMKINSYVSVGDKKNERTWRQFKDGNQGYIVAEYNPASGKITSKGKILKTIK